jgi:hypothetical protein
MSVLLALQGGAGSISDSGTCTFALVPSGTEALVDLATVNAVFVTTGSDALVDLATNTEVFVTTGSDALADAATDAMALVVTGIGEVLGGDPVDSGTATIIFEVTGFAEGGEASSTQEPLGWPPFIVPEFTPGSVKDKGTAYFTLTPSGQHRTEFAFADEDEELLFLL